MAEHVRDLSGSRASERARPRRVLLAVVGLMPQVITETIYALAKGRAEPWVPDEIWAVTTAAGAQRIRERLLPGGLDRVGSLLREYELGPILFDDSHVLCPRGPGGDVPEDADTEETLLAIGDILVGKVAELADDAGCELHVSIAGGRKSMGYLAGNALSLLGRACDELSHVLVNPPFEDCPEFFYPPPRPRKLLVTDPTTRREYYESTAKARLAYARVPFLRLRETLPKDLLRQAGTLGFSGLVAAAQRSLAPKLMLELRVPGRKAVCDGQAVELDAVDFAFYSALFAGDPNGIPRVPATYRAMRDVVDRYVDVVGQARPIRKQKDDATNRPEALLAKFGVAREQGLDEKPKPAHLDAWQKWLEQRRSKTNEALKSGVAQPLWTHFLVPTAEHGWYRPPRNLEVKVIEEDGRKDDDAG